MGTLTADVPLLDEYCVHKLPTSCRLTSLHNCCACADTRPHAAAYRTYIDGVGYVLVGTRWQRYCWFCREFWDNRVRASGITVPQSRIPEQPDQTAFLDRWYEFHRGYRTVVQEDGREVRVAVVGEDMRDVAPGCMPRTLEEMQHGRPHSAFDVPLPAVVTQAAPAAPTGPSLDQTLDNLFDSAVAEENAAANTSAVANAQPPAAAIHNNIHAQAMQVDTERIVARTQQSARRIAALRRELFRMRNGIERVVDGLRELGAIPPDATETTERLSSLGRALEDAPADVNPQQAARSAIAAVNQLARTANHTEPPVGMAARVEEARERSLHARRMRDQAAVDLEHAEQEMQTSQQILQQMQRDQRVLDNYTRVFGTREEMDAQGEDYRSPIGGMFDAAWQRFRDAENTRQEQQTLRRALADEQAVGGEENARRLAEIDAMEPDVWGVPQSPSMRDSEPSQGIQHADTSNTTQLMEMARDEVFDGSPLAIEHLSPEARDAALHEQLMALERENLRRLLSSRARADLQAALPADAANSLTQQLTTASAHESGRLEGDDTSAQQDENMRSRLYELTDDNRALDIGYLLQRAANGLARPSSSDVDESLYQEIAPLSLQWQSNQFVPLHHPTIDRLFAEDAIVWQVGLPAEWFARAIREGHRLGITADPTSDGREEQRQNIEAMAQAFQQSAGLRRQSGLDPRAQLIMLYRLQAGERSEEHRRVLWQMLHNEEIVTMAVDVLRQRVTGHSQTIRARVEALNHARQRAARSGPPGNFSRAELEARRQEAMHGRPRVDMIDSSTQRSLDLLRISSVGPDAPAHILVPGADRPYDEIGSDEEVDVDEDAGLDAKGTGRPEPMEEDDMKMTMDCRICFAQIADIACLPCGHLVMCKWCSDQHSPTFRQDATRPRHPAKCPVCRKGIKQKVRIFRA